MVANNPSQLAGRAAILASMFDDTPLALEALEIPVGKIVPNPHQPRKRPFDPERDDDDAGLVSSVKEHGVIQPIGVVALPGGLYQILYGERRWRASIAAGKETIPAVIKDKEGQLGDTQQAIIALIENLQRFDLSIDEVLDGLLGLQKVTGKDWEQLGQLVGKTTRTMRRYRQIAELDPEVRQKAVEKGWGIMQLVRLAGVPADKQMEMVEQASTLQLPAGAIQETARQLAQQPDAEVRDVAQQVASAHKPRPVKPRRRSSQSSDSSPAGETWEITSAHEQVIAMLLAPPANATPQEKRELTMRAKSLREQVTSSQMDVVDTRHAALLMRHNKTIPSPAAVGMAQSLRGTKIGKMLGFIESGLDMAGDEENQFILSSLTGNQNEAVLAILDYLYFRIGNLYKTAKKNK